MLKLKCGRCDNEINVPNSYGGRKVRCPQCSRILKVPARESSSPVAPTWTEYLKASKAAVFIAMSIILFGIFWLEPVSKPLACHS